MISEQQSKQQSEHHRSSIWCEILQKYKLRAQKNVPLIVEGKLDRMVGLPLEPLG